MTVHLIYGLLFCFVLLDLESPRFPEPLHAPLAIVGDSSPSVLSTSASFEQSTKSFSGKVGDVIADHSDEDSSDHDSDDGSSGTHESMPPLEQASSEESLSTLTRSGKDIDLLSSSLAQDCSDDSGSSFSFFCLFFLFSLSLSLSHLLSLFSSL